MYDWDLFISHASEDKKEAAIPLANKLTAFGLKVWIDAAVLTIGDSLREQIDLGLSKSQIKWVSPNYDCITTRNTIDIAAAP